MKKYRLPVLITVILLVLLKWGWDHRPWRGIVFQGYVEGEYVHMASPVSDRLENPAVPCAGWKIYGNTGFRPIKSHLWPAPATI